MLAEFASEVSGLSDATTGSCRGLGTGTGGGQRKDGAPLGGMLIVCHRQQLDCWTQLARASPSLRLLCYSESLAERRKRGARGPSLLGLTCFDVVVTTFDILKAEEAHGLPALPAAGAKACGASGSNSISEESSIAWYGEDATETETAAAQSYLHFLRWYYILFDHHDNTTVKPTNAKGRAARRLCGTRKASLWTDAHDARQHGPAPGIDYSGAALKAYALCMDAPPTHSVADLVFDARK